MSKNAKSKAKASYHFHPFEISVVGYSGTGKTTLITRLIEDLKSRWSIAYVKHDAHSFEMDKAGKDTFKAREAGASAISISNAARWAHIADGQSSLFTQKSLHLDWDSLIIEGYKSLDMDKICLLDAELSILKELGDEGLARVKAFVGQDQRAPEELPPHIPYYHRDQIQELSRLVENQWGQLLKERPLRALVLAGGRSERMGHDKGRIDYHGQPQALWLCRQLKAMDIRPSLSLREGQWTEEELGTEEVLIDRFLGFGPLSGLLSAMHEDPFAAWLVIACDLPLLNDETLRHLIQHRDPKRMATAYRSSSDGLPEPLCAIYEPKIRMRLHEAMALGLSCPRKVLLNSASLILEPIDSLALSNANTQADREIYLKLVTERRHDA